MIDNERSPSTLAAPMQSFLGDLLSSRAGEQFDLHERYMNRQMVRVLRTIGYDRDYIRAEGPYLFDNHGTRYLDLLSGWGVFGLGRNHPTVTAALKDVLDSDMPNLVQMDVSLLAGLLAEELVKNAPHDGLSKVFFANSGTEAVEGALKLARYATGREGVVFCSHSFHGLTYGALSLNGEHQFRDGFGPFLGGCKEIPFNDLAALEQALSGRDVAAFIVEPIQGKGVNMPEDDYLKDAAEICRKYGTLFIADEIQTGLGRTGKMWAVEHWDAEPDMLLMAKSLSGGHVPVGAIMMRPAIFDAVFDRMDRAVVHGSTFGKNNMAMAAGLATMHVLREEKLVENAARLGTRIMTELEGFIGKHEFVHHVRGKGLIIAIEFGKPKSLRLQAAWRLLEKANESLFSQMVLVPLFADQHILTQVAGHGQHTIKLLPPLVINDADADWIVNGFDKTIGDCHKVPGAMWDLGRRLAGYAMTSGRGGQKRPAAE